MRAFFLLPVLFVCISTVAQTPVDTTLVLNIGGIKQFVNIKGADNSKPLLLFLHGGPGSSMMSYADKFTAKLQKHFVIIQWDQRETGQTLRLNSSPVPLTASLFQDDTRILIETLLRRFNQEKLYLAGHSWGTFLGFYIAKNYPELLYAYIPICPMINQLESERMSLLLMLKRPNNLQEKAALSNVKVPFENGDHLYAHRKGLVDLTGLKLKLEKRSVLKWSSTWLPVFNEASKENLFETTAFLECPVYFFAGRNDYQTNSSLTEAYCKELIAPKKELFWFEYSGHFIPSTEPDRLQNIIIDKILPETFIKTGKENIQTVIR